jgi:hypothetical protein
VKKIYRIFTVQFLFQLPISSSHWSSNTFLSARVNTVMKPEIPKNAVSYLTVGLLGSPGRLRSKESLNQSYMTQNFDLVLRILLQIFAF